MSNPIRKVFCSVLFFLAVFSILSGGSCLQQPCHNPVDPFTMNPALHQQLNRPENNPIQNSDKNLPPQIATTIPQPNYIQPNHIQPNYIQPNYQPNYPPVSHPNYSHPSNIQPNDVAENWSKIQTQEIRQVFVDDVSPSNYRYNNSAGGEILQVSLRPSDSSASTASNSGGDGITIDPSLKNLGADVLAQGGVKEEFQGVWRPDVQFGFFPHAEYLIDGGDGGGDGRFGNAKIVVEDDWTVRNLEIGDTAAHYDTVDGRTEVEASNRVHIYSPRFCAVRKVEGVVRTDQTTSFAEVNQQTRVNTGKSAERAGRTTQEFVAAGYTRGQNDLQGMRSRVMGAAVESNLGTSGYSNVEGVASYSDTLRLMRLGSAEIIHLAEGCQNARQWQGAGGVQVKASYSVPMSTTAGDGVGQLFKIDDSGVLGKSKLRLIKVASKRSAKSGDIIEFTLRFDNLGTEPIGNITIIDNLTTRLEFISGSAMSSLESGFLVEPNDAASFTLRFEITNPLESGQFGVVQFRCRVL